MGILTDSMGRLREEIVALRRKRSLAGTELQRQSAERRAAVMALRTSFSRDRARAHRSWFGPTASERRAAEMHRLAAQELERRCAEEAQALAKAEQERRQAEEAQALAKAEQERRQAEEAEALEKAEQARRLAEEARAEEEARLDAEAPEASDHEPDSPAGQPGPEPDRSGARHHRKHKRQGSN